MKRFITASALLLGYISGHSQHELYESESQLPKILRNEISFGLENYSKTSLINGGNYLYGGFHYQVFSQLAVGGKISSDLAPNTFEDVFTQVGIRLNSPVEIDKFGRTLGLYYAHNFNSKLNDPDYLGLELCLLAFHSEPAYEIDILPITLLYGLDDNRLSLAYKFIGMKINF